MLGMPAMTLPDELHICVMSAPVDVVMVTPLMGFHTTTFLPNEWMWPVIVLRKLG